MRYYEIEFTLTPCTDDIRDVLAALAGEAGCESFEETPFGLKAYVQQPLYDESMMETLVADFPFPDINILYKVREAEYRDWNEEWEQEGFEPIVIRGERHAHALVIYDGRHLPQDTPQTTIPSPLTTIEIDAHMAFGTGTHETSRMMCSELWDMELDGKRVLDCGSGTGLLGICALKGGASWCTAYDIDEWSADNTRHNAVINGVDNRMTILCGDASVIDTLGSDGDSPTRFDVVVANINRNILLQDMERMRSVMAPGATLLLSGFYTSDSQMLTDKAATLGLRPAGERTDGEWACLRFDLG